MMDIKMNMTLENVNKFCSICDGVDFDVNVMCGRVCVDGRSVLGVTQMCGRVVDVVPVTQDHYEIESFYRSIQELGAYKSEVY